MANCPFKQSPQLNLPCNALTKAIYMPIPSQTPLIRAEGLTKSFGDRVLFKDADLRVEPGQLVALIGPSGAGKSTLLNCLEGIETIDAGTIEIAGQPIASLTEPELARLRSTEIGTVFQFFHLLPTLTAFENIELSMLLKRIAPSKRRERVIELMNQLGINHRQDAFPSELSGGEMQRVAIARAIAHKPSVIFADEPTGNLDSKSGTEALEILTQLCSDIGAGMLMVTHSETAASYCSSKYSLVDGELAPV